jgi:hypothetical protein
MSKADVTPTKETQKATTATQEPKPARTTQPKDATHTERKVVAATTAAELSAHEAASSVADASNQKAVVYYVSAAPENVSFAIKIAGEDYSPSWDKSRKHLVWRIPKELTERFEAHSHFTSGRVLRSKEV